MSRISTKVAFTVCGLLLPPVVRAQSPPPPAPITWTTHSVQSKALGNSRVYFVAVPQGYEQSTTRYPVLILLDASDQPQFVAALANLRFLAHRGEVPGLIVVGIPNGADRTRNMTPPTHDPEEMKRARTAGGADQFLAFLGDEVLEAVRSSYRTLPTTLLAGHSFGGLFALHSAVSRPGKFTGFIAMSPSLQWSKGEYIVPFADQLSKMKQPLRLFVSSGGLEASIDTTTRRFIARLDSTGHPVLALRYQRYPDDTHGLTPLPSLIDGVRFMFEPVSLRFAEAALSPLPQTADSASIVRTIDAIQQRYAAGARQLALPESLPESILNQYGYITLQWFNNPAAAIAIFRRNVELYPGSANVYDSLGDALLAKGDKLAAEKQFEKAIELAKQTGDEMVLRESTRKLGALKQKS